MNSKGNPRFLGMFWDVFWGVLAVLLEVFDGVLVDSQEVKT